MINKFKKMFSFEEKDETTDTGVNTLSEKMEEEINRSKNVRNVYGLPTSHLGQKTFMLCNGADEIRKQQFTVCMDSLLKSLKNEIVLQPLLARVIRNVANGVLKEGISFQCVHKDVRDLKKEKQLEKCFYQLIKNSGYLDNEFIEEIIMNLIKYSNSFILPKRVSNEKTGKNTLESLLVTQNIGWKVEEAISPGYAKTYSFSGKTYKANSEVLHFTFNKESDETFGIPIWISVIPFLVKYNYLISSTIDSYSDQSIEKTIFEVGVTGSGNFKPVTPKAFSDVSSMLQNYPKDDLITDVPVRASTLKKDYTSPDKVLDVLELQVIAGLYTSESQLGRNGAGRQDAEAQQENTNAIINDFQTNLANHLNKTIIKEICKELFGDNLDSNDIRLIFNDAFNKTERVEKHEVFKFQSGLCDINEARTIMGYKKPIDKNNSFFELYQKNEMDGQVASVNSPSNQHTSGTGTTKATKKN